MTLEIRTLPQDFDDLYAAHTALRAAQVRTAEDLRSAKDELAKSRAAEDHNAKAHAQALADISAKHDRVLEAVRQEHRDKIDAATRQALEDARIASKALADRSTAHGRELEAIRQQHRDASSAAADLARDHAQAASRAFADRLAERDIEMETLRREHQASAEAAARQLESARHVIAEQEARSVGLEEAVATAQNRTDELLSEHANLLEEVAGLRKAHDLLRSEAATARAQAAAAQSRAEEVNQTLIKQSELSRAAASASLALERKDSVARLDQIVADHTAVLAQANASAAEEIHAISQSLAIAQETLAATRASNSWRITRPLRSIAFRMKRLVRG